MENDSEIFTDFSSYLLFFPNKNDDVAKIQAMTSNPISRVKLVRTLTWGGWGGGELGICGQPNGDTADEPHVFTVD